MKNTLTGFILLSVLYFVGGWALVVWGPMPMNVYVISASIVGSLASALGLLSLVRPGVTRQDLKAVEMGTLREIGELSKDLEAISEEKERLSQQKSQTESEIEQLERQRREMEVLVKKASLILLYESDLRNLEHQIERFIQGESELQSAVQSFTSTKAKLDALQHEVQTSEDAELLCWVLSSAKERERRLELKQEPPKQVSPFDFLIAMAEKLSNMILRF